MADYKFSSKIIDINGWKIVLIPMYISKMIPSRGMVMVDAQIDDQQLTLALEPDGKGSHFFRVDGLSNLQVNDMISMSISPTDSWTEPEILEDLEIELIKKDLIESWELLTTKARWQWIRWIRSTKNPDTRHKRILKASSMLEAGKKRPCCFNQNMCTITQVSKNGVIDD